MNIKFFFRDNSRIIALPDWDNPRLFLPADGPPARRWRMAKLFPAYRITARLYRNYIRLKALWGKGKTRLVKSSIEILEVFLKNTQVDNVFPVIMIGTPGPAQKFTIQLWNKQNMVVAYLKYAEKKMARQRLRHEYKVLLKLPMGIGPKPLKYGCIGKGEGLLISPIKGNPLSVKLPPSKSVYHLLNNFKTGRTSKIENHPAIKDLRLNEDRGFTNSLAVLSKRPWEIVIEHGDFTPWNILQTSDKKISAIDWEYGSLEGFPYIDLIYYYFQVGVLIYRWQPNKAFEKLKRYLKRYILSNYNGNEIQALITISIYAAYRRRKEDGHLDEDSMQKWRSRILKKLI